MDFTPLIHTDETLLSGLHGFGNIIWLILIHHQHTCIEFPSTSYSTLRLVGSLTIDTFTSDDLFPNFRFRFRFRSRSRSRFPCFPLAQFASLECDNWQYIQNLTRLPYVLCH